MDDGRLELARAIPIMEVADRLGIAGLSRAGVERVGPCPVCGGHDRFGINPPRDVFFCRHCDVGGNGLALVRHVMGCDFRAALAFLAGEADVQVDPGEVARRQRAAEQQQAARAAFAAQAREWAIKDAREIWHRAQPGDATPAAAYLAARSIVWPWGHLPPTLRYIADHPYKKKIGGTLRTLHTGPALIAAIQDADNRITAVHQTWINPDLPGEKAQITFEGEAQAAKMVRGSKKGGAIRLSPPGDAGVLIMGEGIETTASALAADVVPGAAYWAGVDLGNMAGRQIKVPGVRYSGTPDLSDDAAFAPPPWVRRLVFIQDGDSDPDATRAKLRCGLRRAQVLCPAIDVQIVHAGAGVDLNDVARKPKNDGGADER